MGVDVRMVVRVPNGNFTNLSLRPIAAQMCATIGVDKFFISEPGKWSWNPPEGKHALTLSEYTSGAYLAEFDEDDLQQHELTRLKSVEPERPIMPQDGPALIAEPNEQFISVHLWSRYYGPGYERGDWPTIRATAEFLEHAFPGATIFYGGDSSGICAEPFDRAARDRMNEHYLALGHQPYRGYRGSWDDSKRPTCDFCGGREMISAGGGGSNSVYLCDGCGLYVAVNHVTGKRAESRDGKDGFSDALAKLRAT